MVTFKELGRWGRLGNQLFQIACTIGHAITHGTDAVFPAWGDYSQHFDHHLNESLNPDDVSIEYGEPSFEYRQIPFFENMSLLGCFQSERYFEHCQDEIRRQFVPAEHIHRELDTQFSNLLDNRMTCGLHVRRGDYLQNYSSHPPCPLDYYERAMNHFGKNFDFIVCSDDIEWCKKNFKGDNLHFVDPTEPVDYVRAAVCDLFLMSWSKHNIISNSSFSWWSAWLNDNPQKQVIAPQRWFGPRLARYNTDDLIPKDWQII